MEVGEERLMYSENELASTKTTKIKCVQKPTYLKDYKLYTTYSLLTADTDTPKSNQQKTRNPFKIKNMISCNITRRTNFN